MSFEGLCKRSSEGYETTLQKEERFTVARYKDKEIDGNSFSYNFLKSTVLTIEKLLIPKIIPSQLNLFGIHNNIVNFDFSVRDHVATPLMIFVTNKVIANVTLLVSDSLTENKEELPYKTLALAETFTACLVTDNSLLFGE